LEKFLIPIVMASNMPDLMRSIGVVSVDK